MRFGKYVILLCLISSAYSITIYYVNPTGSDANNCLTVGAPCKTLSHASSIAAAGDIINLAAGTYRQSTGNNSSSGIFTPKANQTFIGPICTPSITQCTAIVTGGTIIGGTGCTSPCATGPDANGNWSVTGQTQAGVTSSSCDTGWGGCIYPEELFIDGVPSKHMPAGTALNTLVSGQWVFDYVADIIYFHDNPSGHVVETSVLKSLFNPNINGVTLQYLTVEEFAVQGGQGGAIDPAYATNPTPLTGAGWTVESCYVTLNHSTGIRVGFGMKIRNSVSNMNGGMGIGGGPAAGVTIVPSQVVITNNIVMFNNYAHFSPGQQAGGIKFGNIAGVVMRGNTVSNNIGQGIHTDVNAYGALIDGNTVEYNSDPIGSGSASVGIVVEISEGKNIIRNNIVRYNGNTSTSGPNYQISSANSTGVEAYCNVMEVDNNIHNGLWTVFSSNRGTYPSPPNFGLYVFSTGNSIHHNTAIMDAGGTSTMGFTHNDTVNQPNFFANNTPPDYNQYHVPNIAATLFKYDNDNTGANTNRNFTNYKGKGADVHGTIDTLINVGFPSVSITSPTDQTTFLNNIAITATASDGSGILKAQLYVDWVLVQTINGAGPYTFTLTNLSFGNHIIAVYAWANSGVQNCNAISVVQANPGYNSFTGKTIAAWPTVPNMGSTTKNGTIWQDSSYPSGTPGKVFRCTDNGTNPDTAIKNQSKSAGLQGSGDAWQLFNFGNTLLHYNSSGGTGYIVPLDPVGLSCGNALTNANNLTTPGSASISYNFGNGSFSWSNANLWFSIGKNPDASTSQIEQYTINPSTGNFTTSRYADLNYGLPINTLITNAPVWQATHAYTRGQYISYTMQASDSLRPFDWQVTYSNFVSGDIIVPLLNNTNNCSYKLVTTGITGAVEPNWDASNCSPAFGTITDGTAKWRPLGGLPTFIFQMINNNGTSGGTIPHLIPVATGHPDLDTIATDNVLNWQNMGLSIQPVWNSISGMDVTDSRVCAGFSTNGYGYLGSYINTNAGQGSGIFAVCYDNNLGEYVLINTLSGIESLVTCTGGTGYNCSGGTFSMAPLGQVTSFVNCGFFIHNFKGNSTMDYPAMTVQGNPIPTGCFPSNPGQNEFIWAPFIPFDVVATMQPVYGSVNHIAIGQKKLINIGQNTNTFGFSTGVYGNVYDLMNPFLLSDVFVNWQPFPCDTVWLPNNVNPPCQLSLAYDSHLSQAFNPTASPDVSPVCGNVYNLATLAPPPVAAYQGEFICVSTSPTWTNGGTIGNQTQWRFAHNFCTGGNSFFDVQFCVSQLSSKGDFGAFGSDWNCTLGDTTGLTTNLCGPPWVGGSTYILNQLVNPFSSTGGSGTNYGVYKVTTPGIAASTAPTWFVCNSGTVGNTVTDLNGVVYTCMGTGTAKGEVFVVQLNQAPAIINNVIPMVTIITKNEEKHEENSNSSINLP